MPDNQKINCEIKKAAQAIKHKFGHHNRLAIITGTGLGGISKIISRKSSLSYSDIPGFAKSTVQSHSGVFIGGSLAGVGTLMMSGRYHLYEGHSAQTLALPVRALCAVGVKYFIMINAAGGLHNVWRAGDVMMIEDHINLTGQNPLVGLHLPQWGDRFPDMSLPYCQKAIQISYDEAVRQKMDLRKGVYACVKGPSLETRAETRMLKMLGCDAVGMSTVAEVIVACQAGAKVAAFSAISNINDPDNMRAIGIGDIIDGATGAEEKLKLLIMSLARNWVGN